jgi:hypothetical protein
VREDQDDVCGSKERFKRELDGIQVELQDNNSAEVGLDVIQGRAN